MFRKNKPQNNTLNHASLSMVDANTKAPLTSKVQAVVASLSKRGATVMLHSAFIDNFHILMDVHNIERKFAQVSFPPDNPQTQEEINYLGEIKSLSQIKVGDSPKVRVELNWVETSAWGGLRHKTLKRLIRLAKSSPGLMEDRT
ncbi:MAG: hypothetical protein PVG60_03130 [Desulfarculaceae bacterium]|jgi:hypothetical protein